VLRAGGSEIDYTFDGHEERTGIPALLKRLGELGIGYRDLNTRQSSLEDIFVTLVSDRPGCGMSAPAFNRHGVWAIYRFEMARAFRTPLQSFLTPVITTSLYFVVFGAAIGRACARWAACPTAPSSCRG
jgi:hypothetical protein